MGTIWAVGEGATESSPEPFPCAWEPLQLVFLCLVVNQGVNPKEWGENAARGNKVFVKIGCSLKSIHFVSYTSGVWLVLQVGREIQSSLPSGKVSFPNWADPAGG